MKQKNLGLELLRFALASAVMLFHYFFLGPITGVVSNELYAGEALLFGNFAVSAFFIISGYVIYYSARKSSFRNFVASRISRLYPALAASAIITTLALTYARGALAPHEARTLAEALVFAPLFFNKGQVDPSYWSIVFEIRFYLLVGLLVLCSALGSLVRGLTLLALLGLSIYLLSGPPEIYEYLLFPHISFFAIGALMAVAGERRTGVVDHCLMACHFCIATIGTYIELSPIDMQHDGVRYPFWVSALIVCVCVLLVVGATKLRVPRRFTKVALFLGGLSYPLYLVHQVAGYVFITLLTPELGPVPASILAIAIVLLIAAFIHKVIEGTFVKPLRAAISGRAALRSTPQR